MIVHIVLDTSFVVKCAQWRIDLFSEFDRVMSSPYSLRFIDKSLNELESVALQGGKERSYAKLARLFYKRARIISTSGEGLVFVVFCES